MSSLLSNKRVSIEAQGIKLECKPVTNEQMDGFIDLLPKFWESSGGGSAAVSVRAKIGLLVLRDVACQAWRDDEEISPRLLADKLNLIDPGTLYAMAEIGMQFINELLTIEGEDEKKSEP